MLILLMCQVRIVVECASFVNWNINIAGSNPAPGSKFMTNKRIRKKFSQRIIYRNDKEVVCRTYKGFYLHRFDFLNEPLEPPSEELRAMIECAKQSLIKKKENG
jgi:hypothetical protein